MKYTTDCRSPAPLDILLWVKLRGYPNVLCRESMAPSATFGAAAAFLMSNDIVATGKDITSAILLP